MHTEVVGVVRVSVSVLTVWEGYVRNQGPVHLKGHTLSQLRLKSRLSTETGLVEVPGTLFAFQLVAE